MMEVLDWKKLNEHIERSVPAIVPLERERKIVFVVNEGATKLGLRVPWAAPVHLDSRPFQELTVEQIRVKGEQFIQVSTGSPALFDIFYMFGCTVAEGVVEHALDAPAAIQVALSKFGQLIAHRTIMAEEVQLGLLGELCVLEAAIKSKGITQFAAWLGPSKARHDFRFSKNEIEVKVTRRTERIHVIHGVAQLEPSAGHRLFVLSFQFELAGNSSGRSLSDRVATVRALLPAGSPQRITFEAYLAKLSYRDADATFYAEKMKFFRPAVLIEVTDAFPAITSAKLLKSHPSELLGRISRVQYEVNLEGLGVEESHAEFRKVLSDLSTLE